MREKIKKEIKVVEGFSREKKKKLKSSLTVRSCPSWWDAEGWFAVRTFRPRIVYRVPALKKKNGIVNRNAQKNRGI